VLDAGQGWRAARRMRIVRNDDVSPSGESKVWTIQANPASSVKSGEIRVSPFKRVQIPRS
jgi:hypothetical protein